MLAAKNHESSKTKAEKPTAQVNAKGGTAERVQVNPLWQQLATRVQAKLTVGAPDDPYESEADRVADQVMRMPDESSGNRVHSFTSAAASTAQRKCPDCEEEEKLQRKPLDNTSIPPRISALNGPVAARFPLSKQESVVQRQEMEDEVEMMQLKPAGGGSAVPVVTPNIEAGINSLKGRGQPLSESTRAFFEPRFGMDFSEVRVHTGSQAAETAKLINARAFTVGNNIAFGAGRFAPESQEGRKLMAHELTHVAQQNGSLKTKMQPDHIQRAPGPSQQTNYSGTNKSIDIRGKTKLILGKDFSGYLASFFIRGLQAPITVTYGNMGSGIIYISPRILVLSEECGPIFPVPILDIFEECDFYFNSALSSYDASPQVIPFELPELDTSAKNGILALKVEIIGNDIVSNEINSGDTNRALGWVDGKTKTSLDPFDYVSADFSREAFLPFIYGKDYDGKNFSGSMYTNHMSGGYLIFNSVGGLALPNQQNLFGLIQLGDTNNWWHTTLTTNIMGSEDYELPIKRTDKGELSGEGDGITFDETWTGKGFKAEGKLHVSYVNSNLFVMGTASYESKRAKGNLLIILTDYTTAKRYATEFLPDDIAKKSKTDLPPNPADRLAFAGSGNISMTLFDGNKESRKKDPVPKDVIGDEPEPQPNRALQADASFVVEPEGYITIAGQVRTQQKTFELFPEKSYEKTIPIADFTIFSIPGPLGTSANFDFSVDLSYGASIGPLTLSEIKADGLYSSRPDTASELELSALVKLLGKLFVGLKVCISVKGSLLKVFSVEIVEYCPLDYRLAAVGAIQARPTIQVVSPAKDPDRSTPPEYYIRGSFNFDVAGQLILQLGDSLTINLTKEDSKDPKDPSKDKDVEKEWKYKRNRKTVKNSYGSKDVVIPMDHTLGSEEIPRVSIKSFIKDNLEERIKKLITQDRPPERKYEKEYFEPGKEKAVKAAADDDKKLKAGGYEEQGEERGNIAEDTKPAPAKASPLKYVFTEDFLMNGFRHTLSLVISQIDKAGSIDFESVLMMESELEEISEKIEEEKQEIKDHPDPAADFKMKDIAGIEAEATRIKEDARKLGIDNELSNKPQYPALKGMAVSVHNYGDRYKKKDLGIPDQTIQPKCNKPSDVHPGQEIIFSAYKGEGNMGKVIEVVSYVTPDRKSAYWHIRFRPYGSRSGNSVAPPAYDENCKPAYYITKAKNCEGIDIKKHEKLVPERIVNGRRIPDRFKADWVKAYPLCWGEEQVPDDDVVGIDRIDLNRRAVWHRAHLVHGKMGGPGTRWNLVPVPKHVNNEDIPREWEIELKDLVQKGIASGKQYWFEAKIIYHQSEDNAVIGHYNDFVKEIQVSFGELDKNAHGDWEFKKGEDKKVELDKIPLRDDLAPNRVKG